MKKLIFIFLIIPLTLKGQESRYVEIEVVDQYGNNIGTMSMMARETYNYGNGYEIAVEKYIQYLREKESREIAEKKFNLLNNRLSNLGLGRLASWAQGTAVEAAMEGYAIGVENSNTLNRGNESVSESEYNNMIESYNRLVTEYNKYVSNDKHLKRKKNVIGQVSLSKWNTNVRETNRLYKKIKKIRKQNEKGFIEYQKIVDDSKKSNPELVYVINSYCGISKNARYDKNYLGYLKSGDEVVLVSKNLVNKNYYAIKYYSGSSNIAYIPKYSIDIKNDSNEIETDITKTESQNPSANNRIQKSLFYKEIEVFELTKLALDKFNDGDINGAILESSKAISLDKSILRTERTRPSPSQTYANRGFFYSKKGEFDKAIEDYNTAIKIDPKMIFAYHYRGFAKMSNENYNGAISDFSKAYELNKEKDEYKSNLYQSKLKYTLGYNDDAIAGYKASIKLYPQESYLSLYVIYNDLGKTEESNEMANRILSLPSFEGQLDVLYNNAIKLASDKKNASDVVSIAKLMMSIRKELSLDDTETEYNLLGWGKRESGDYYGAIASYTKALEINPQSANNRGGMGTAKFYLGDLSGACSDWNTAIKMESISYDSKEHYQKFINENCGN